MSRPTEQDGSLGICEMCDAATTVYRAAVMDTDDEVTLCAICLQQGMEEMERINFTESADA